MAKLQQGKLYYMELDPFKLTDMITEETVEYECLQDMLKAALNKRCTVYSYDLTKAAEAIINNLFVLGYKEVPTADIDNLNSEIGSKEFVQFGSFGGTKNNTIQIRAKQSANKLTYFRNAAILFGEVEIEEIIEATIGEADLDFEVPVMCERILDLLKKGHTGLTLSSNAKNDLMNRCFGKFNKNTNQYEYGWKNFKDVFPVLDDNIHNYIMKAYKGGICYFNKDYIGITEVEGTELDVNSMYPAVMLQEELPYGEAEYFEGQYIQKKSTVSKLYVQKFKVGKMTIKEGFPAWLKDEKTKEEIESAENIELTLCNVDIDNLLKCYDVEDVEYIDGYAFDKRIKMFDNYINYWAEQKKQAEDGSFDRFYAKMMLNSSYGKFASKINKKPSYYFYNPIRKKYVRTNYVTGKKSVEGSSVYAPVGVFITAYARKRLLDAIISNKDNFIYSDTDSIYVKGEAKGLEIDPKEIGAWKQEFKFTKMNIIGKKQYCVQKDDGSIKVTLAGIPDILTEEITTFDEFYQGKEFSYDLYKFDLDGYVVVEKDIKVTIKNENIK